ncbi:DNA primase, partial [Streptomyces sp. FL06-04B]|nr:DNA primase [Streptomyces sp. FL06-04B]MDX3739575.1 DNA primase [Streptomyces sp. ID01-15D]
MTPRGGSPSGFDAHAVAAQIIARSTSAGPRPAGEIPGHAAASAGPEQVSGVGLLPDSLTDRGNAKLFVRLYAQDYRHVTG